jgi:hypothetical protein
MQQVAFWQVHVNVTVNMAVNVTQHSPPKEREEVFHAARLSSNSRVSKLNWTHTTEALGSNVTVYVNKDIRTKELVPKVKKGPSLWKIVGLPVIAGMMMSTSCDCSGTCDDL